MEDYNNAIHLDSSDGEAYIRRGILYLAMEKYKKAVEEIEYGLKLKPELQNDASVINYLKQAKDKLK
jgi:tetratricopeptide (TPR) repeat protein